MFPVRNRCCTHCSASLPTLLACSKCKVCVYCNTECQRAHWKACHKKTCKTLTPQPPNEEEFMSVNNRCTDKELDVPYKYIVLSPGMEGQSEEEFWNTTRGIEADKELDDVVVKYGPSALGIDDNTRRVLSERYNWPTGPSGCVVPGFSSDYDGCNLYAYFDDNMSAQTQLAKNSAGCMVLMKESCRGSIVLTARAIDRDTGSQTDVLLTRRQILSLVEYNSLCGLHNAVSKRVHFENIRRSEKLLDLKSQNFQFVNL